MLVMNRQLRLLDVKLASELTEVRALQLSAPVEIDSWFVDSQICWAGG